MKAKILAALNTIREIVLAVRDIIAGLSTSQRKALYKAAVAIGTAIAVKFGLDATNVAGYIETAVVFASTVLVPLFAHTKATD